MPTLKRSHILIPALMLLSACGGGGGCSPTDGRPLDSSTSTTDTCGNVRGPYTIAISYPTSDAIEVLDTKPGFYSYNASLVVTDQNGNHPPDGTIVQLDAIDTILAKGTITGADSISGSTLAIGVPTLTDGTVTTLDVAGVRRGAGNAGPIRYIEQGDVVILRNADKNDQYRFVASTPTATTVTVTSPFNSIYPNVNYAGVTNSTEYFIGQSVLGVSVTGFDPANGDKPLSGHTKTVDGNARFRLEYPANSSTINLGCSGDVISGFENGSGIESIDYRFNILNSADVAVIAQLDGSSSVTTVNWEGCFAAILDLILTAPATASVSVGGTVSFFISLTDANLINLPYRSISASADNGNAAVVDQDLALPGIQVCALDTNNGFYATTATGGCLVEVEGLIAGDTSIILAHGAASGTVKVTVTP